MNGGAAGAIRAAAPPPWGQAPRCRAAIPGRSVLIPIPPRAACSTRQREKLAALEAEMAEKLQLVRAHAGAWPAAVCMCGAGCMPRPPAATPQNAAPPHFRPASPAAGTAPPLSSWAATRAPPHLAGRWSNWRTCAISWPRRRRSCRQRCRPRTASWQRCSRPPPASAAAWPAAIPGPAQVGDRPERTARSAQMTAGPAQPASRGGGGVAVAARAHAPRSTVLQPAGPLPPCPPRPAAPSPC